MGDCHKFYGSNWIGIVIRRLFEIVIVQFVVINNEG
jgi:hypothetical protein